MSTPRHGHTQVRKQRVCYGNSICEIGELYFSMDFWPAQEHQEMTYTCHLEIVQHLAMEHGSMIGMYFQELFPTGSNLFSLCYS